MTRISRRENFLAVGWSVATAGLALSVFLAGCKSTGQPVSETPTVSHRTGNSSSKELSNAGKILMDTMKDPKKPFHYSYKGLENINEHYAFDKTAKPEVGDVTMEADVSADAVSGTSMRGTKKQEMKARKGDQLSWSLAQLALLSNVSGPAMDIGVVAAMASSAGTDMVNGMAADKFSIDTASAIGNQRAAFDVAKTILTAKEVKGTAWVAKDTGALVKFNLDLSRADDRGNTWQEHCEGEVKPK